MQWVYGAVPGETDQHSWRSCLPYLGGTPGSERMRELKADSCGRAIVAGTV